MTEPKVLVNVADLRAIFDEAILDLFERVKAATEAAIPEPEWEPTDDMPGQYKRAHDLDPDDSNDALRDYVTDCLKAMHREGLL